jgi:2-methylcitrate dehydratase PrpD
MQAHVEGMPGLALQIGNAARNALIAVDLAVARVPGVSRSLDGPFGYLSLFEDDADLTEVLADLGGRWRIVEVSHKPFPTGRAAHGALLATQTLMAEHGVSADNLERLTYRAPPLVHRLVGRRINMALTPNYARLCFAYLGAVTLLRGTVGLADFSAESLADPRVHALAARIETSADDNPDPAAFTPATAIARLRDGRVATVRIVAQPGSPDSPLTWQQQLAKFHSCVDFGSDSGGAKGASELPQLVLAMENESDVTNIWSKASLRL